MRRTPFLAALLVALTPAVAAPPVAISPTPPAAPTPPATSPLAPGVPKAPVNMWARATAPSEGQGRAIGGTSTGCLAGAVELPRRGKGFRVMNPARRKHFGHPLLAAVIRDLGKELERAKLGFLPLGDLSQPRGGPAPDGHASHQTGLDADIWYAVSRGKRPSAVMMVDGKTSATTRAFGKRQARVLRLAASDPRVDRIFVNPVIKHALCQATTKDRAWLAKLRPWWGHDAHFHMRLACPTDSPDCVPQDPIEPGDGCAEVAAWLDPAQAAQKATERQAYRSRIGARPALPAPCAVIEPR